MSYLLKNKKTGKEDIISDDEYREMVSKGTIINRFDIEKISQRTIVPSLKVPEELKTKKTK
jgi:hypothetical protein